jgi:mycothiol synthase
LQLLRDAAAGDSNLKAPSADEWRVFTGSSFNHGATDFALVEEDGRTVGILMSARIPKSPRDVRNFRIIVLPEARRRGIATEVLAHVEEQDPAGDTTLQAECRRSWEDGTAFLAAHGFSVDREELWMLLRDLPDSIEIPEGSSVVAHDGSGLQGEAWKRLTHEAYAGTDSATELTDEDLDVLPTEPGFRLNFLEMDGEFVGLCHVKEYAHQLYVNSLAIRPSHRGRGLGRLMLRHMLGRVRADGVGEMWLTVRSDNSAAVGLYESEGFTTEDVAAKWCKRYE